MPEVDQMVDCLPGAERVVVADDVHRSSATAAADCDDRNLDGAALIASFRSEDDQRFTPVAQEFFDHRFLRSIRCGRAEQQVIAQSFHDRQHPLDEFDLERPAQVEGHAESASALTAQSLGQGVGPVAEFGRRSEHPLPGRLGRPVDAA
jgi:hypothetical protein